jgi:PHS family inorganic phosphate transporter-like MFS transporter
MNNQKEGIVDPISQQKTKEKLGRKLAAPKASWPDVFSYFSQWANFKVIFSTTTSWFFLDLAYYGLGLNNSIVLNAIGYSAGHTIYHSLLHTAIGNLILACAGSLPGYWLSVATIDTIGRKPIQIMGFFLLTIIFIIIGFAYQNLSERSLLTLYILAQFFFNFGPNTTTFIIPGECFPTRYRSTGHGISAAAGKIGAIAAQVIANPLLSKGATPDCTGSACSPWLPVCTSEIFSYLAPFLPAQIQFYTFEYLVLHPETFPTLQTSIQSLLSTNHFYSISCRYSHFSCYVEPWSHSSSPKLEAGPSKS